VSRLDSRGETLVLDAPQSYRSSVKNPRLLLYEYLSIPITIWPLDFDYRSLQRRLV
jgi:hypothetical protein